MLGSSRLLLPRPPCESVTVPLSSAIHLRSSDGFVSSQRLKAVERIRKPRLVTALAAQAEGEQDEGMTDEASTVRELVGLRKRRAVAGRNKRGLKLPFKLPAPARRPRMSDEERMRYERVLLVLEKMFEDEEPSEGMKQLVRLIQANPPPIDLPPRETVPRWLREAGLYIAVMVAGFAFAHVTASLDEQYFRKKMEEEELLMMTQKLQPPEEPEPTALGKAVERAAAFIDEKKQQVMFVVNQKLEVVIQRLQELLSKLGLQN